MQMQTTCGGAHHTCALKTRKGAKYVRGAGHKFNACPAIRCGKYRQRSCVKGDLAVLSGWAVRTVRHLAM